MVGTKNQIFNRFNLTLFKHHSIFQQLENILLEVTDQKSM